MIPQVVKGIYEHYSRSLFLVVGTIEDTITGDWFVKAYPLFGETEECLISGNSFASTSLVNGKEVPSFRFLFSQDPQWYLHMDKLPDFGD